MCVSAFFLFSSVDECACARVFGEYNKKLHVEHESNLVIKIKPIKRMMGVFFHEKYLTGIGFIKHKNGSLKLHTKHMYINTSFAFFSQVYVFLACVCVCVRTWTANIYQLNAIADKLNANLERRHTFYHSITYLIDLLLMALDHCLNRTKHTQSLAVLGTPVLSSGFLAPT